MFVKVVSNHKRSPGTSYVYLTESYRENGKIKHKNVRNLSLLEDDQIPYIKAAFMNPKPRLVYDDKT